MSTIQLKKNGKGHIENITRVSFQLFLEIWRWRDAKLWIQLYLQTARNHPHVNNQLIRMITSPASSPFGLAILAKDIQAALSQYQQVFMAVHDGLPISYIVFL